MSAPLLKTWLPRLLALLLVLAAGPALAQIERPVTWKFAAGPAGADGTAMLTFTASIEGNWHVYSQFIEAGGPEPTAFAFTPSPDYELLGKPSESPAPTKGYDETFKMNIAYFNQRAVFSQKIRLKAPTATVKGTLTFMACNDEKCLPPEDVAFSLAVQGPAGATKASQPAPATPAPLAAAKAPAPAGRPTTAPASGPLPATLPADTARTPTPTPAPVAPVASADTARPAPAETVARAGHPAAPGTVPETLWAIFLAGLAGGLIALVMPCIYPLLPFTVSYFTKNGRATRAQSVGQASLYGLSIVVIYVSLGLLISIVFGPDALNNLATNGIFNFLLFALLVVFAGTFFGAFELTLPSSWIARADAEADKGGLKGLFFMAATLVLVSFSCTGPLIGTLIAEAATKHQLLRPAVGMLGFSLALAVPFTVFALFPSLLKSLPKSGGWLNSIKVVLGFLELALALKFLSNVDLAYHWEWFDREVFLTLWIAIGLLLALYLLGKLRFAHDSELEFLSVPRLLLAIVVLAFTTYLVPGLWGAPLKVVAGFLPPQHTQDFDLYTPTLGGAAPQAAGGPAAPHKYGSLFRAPLGLNAYFDYDEARAAARAAGKPVLIDFTGNACVNCRKMEATVWSDQAVLPILRDQYVLVQLYVDDKTDLPAADQVTLPSGKVLRTIGQKWSNFQTSRYQTNSQPYYVLLDPATERVLVTPEGANYEPANFVRFLQAGLRALHGR